jgi:Holliday junction resolvase
MGRDYLNQRRFMEEDTNRDRATQQEKVAAKRYGGRTKPGSGSSPLSKGDVQTRAFLMEMKGTIHQSLSIKAEWLEKITQEASYEGRYPALEIKLPIQEPLVEDTWVLVPASVFQELNEQAEIKRRSA